MAMEENCVFASVKCCATKTEYQTFEMKYKIKSVNFRHYCFFI